MFTVVNDEVIIDFIPKIHFWTDVHHVRYAPGSRLFWCAVKHAGGSVPLLQQDGAGADESRDAE